MSKLKAALKQTAVAAGPTKNFFKTVIAAQGAAAAPPLGPLLGQYGLNIGNFCKDFNEKTKIYKKGIPLPVTVRIKPDRTWNIEFQTPSLEYYLGQAAGCTVFKEKDDPMPAGKVTIKHIYEIAKIKHADEYLNYQFDDLEDVVKQIVEKAYELGVEVVKELDPVEYGEFLKARNEFLEEREKQRMEELQAKLQRV